MDAAQTITLVRDLFIIVASGVFIIVLLGVGFILLKVYLQLYPVIRRAAHNVEESSNILYNVVAQPLNIVTAVIDLVNRVLGMVESFRSRQRRDEDGESQ